MPSPYRCERPTRAPTMLSARGAYLELSAQEEEALSPLRHAARLPCPLAIVHGERESPEFRRMAVELDAALRVAPLAGPDLRPRPLRRHAGVADAVPPRLLRDRLDPVPERVEVRVERRLAGVERVAARRLLLAAGTLGPAERETALRHAAGCAECRRELEETEAMVNGLRDLHLSVDEIVAAAWDGTRPAHLEHCPRCRDEVALVNGVNADLRRSAGPRLATRPAGAWLPLAAILALAAPVGFWIYVDDCDALFNRAVAAGAQVPPGPMGQLAD